MNCFVDGSTCNPGVDINISLQVNAREICLDISENNT